jgi:hypothetical protein
MNLDKQIHTAKPMTSDSLWKEAEITTEKLKLYEPPGTNLIPAKSTPRSLSSFINLVTITVRKDFCSNGVNM